MYLSHGHHNKKQIEIKLKKILYNWFIRILLSIKSKKKERFQQPLRLYRSGFTCLLWINNNNVYRWFISSYQVVVIKFKDPFMRDGSSSSCILNHWKLMMKLTGSWEIQKKGYSQWVKNYFFFLIFSSQNYPFFCLFLFCSSYFSPAR